ncbi:NAD-dependent epimerase/dehydratase family protein [Terriglobus roseus]|uniref:Nucleoside-diphosphate-sugar epimerase n=1 Tax=Terriglobus roseus TaxID=392734 RepID=A0A1H4JUV5_9BACT|nr:NAD-dependent epimerase/dehydratase family protein [Terriglobus roseus]SEB49993.1 Nucleoside-diphosphate-sugar epimerase [Terriglobus roseus]
MTPITTDEQLDQQLTMPSAADVAFAQRLEGDTVILGAGGKMGPTLAKRLRLALAEAGKDSGILAISRFESAQARQELETAGVETLSADLLNPEAVGQLPHARNVLYLAGRKFGSAADPELTWAMNALVPAWVANHYRKSRIVAFSTGNVYPFVSLEEGGSVETDALAPRGEYAQSCLARERVFQYYSKKFDTPCLIYRLNYAIDLRYGVLVDIARQVIAGEPVDIAVPAVNVLWQGDANSYAIRSLEHCECPARILNVTGPETISVRRAAEFFAERFGCALQLKGEPGSFALLNNASACHAALGYPSVSALELMDAVATWVLAGGSSLNKITKFQVMDGKF